jgi:pyruvate dehydrogenase E1 component alpha subunit
MPIANGLALSSALRSDGRVTIVNFGDGATNIGAFHEALNLASVWSLPVVFVCQNNRYAEHTNFRFSCRNETVAVRAQAYAMPGDTVDGNDPVAVYETTARAVERARDGGGPTLIEAQTFRFFGHFFGDPMTEISAEEMAAARDSDPLPRFGQQLITDGHATEDELAAIESEIEAAIDDAVEFAFTSPDPDPTRVAEGVFAGSVAG